MMNSKAPELIISHWLNTPQSLSIADFRGRILVMEAFQMLCPGCVSHGLPQAQRVSRMFSNDKVAVIGLHCVFEHHEAQGSKIALQAFAHEYKLQFPIGIDQQNRRLPATMSAYAMQGTPTLVIIDRQGNRRFQNFGHLEDMALGHVIGALSGEAYDMDADRSDETQGCRPSDLD